MAFVVEFSLIFAIAGWIAGYLLLWKKVTLKPAGATVLQASVIIPARNEESNLIELLTSLQHQPGVGEVLVIDDQSSDQTATVAAQYGARVVQVTDKPSGWNGKSFACHLGAKEAQYPILIFLDADTRVQPNGISALVQQWQKTKGLLSVQPWHTVQKTYENASALLNVVVIMGMNAFGMRSRIPTGAFGPCLACSKEQYFTTGGHEAVRTELLEDIPFGKNFLAHGLPLNLAVGKGIIHFRMYSQGFKELLNGWAKSFAIGAKFTPKSVLLLSILWLSGALSAFFLLTSVGANRMLFLPFLLFVVQMDYFFKLAGNFNHAHALLYPLHIFFFFFVHAYSHIRIFILKNILWRGRPVHHT
jgi:4,4'-diaponeurosporenoate glycosyltransferase